jgi:tetratricopeptide (TPR) repeat protein
MADDEAARVCAWANRLQELHRIAEARQVLLDALDSPGDTTEIMVGLAELERDQADFTRAIELLKKVLDDNAGSKRANHLLAEILFARGRTEEAAKVIASMPGRAVGEFGELAGVIWRTLGRHELAVEAFNECSLLSRRGRWLRWRSWWRTGGPFRRSSNASRFSPSARELDCMPGTPDELLEVTTWAEWLIENDRREAARQVLSDALATHDRHPRLVRCLAELEDSEDASRTALYLWCEAYQRAPCDVDIVCGVARQLANTEVDPPVTWRVHDALQILAAFPDQSDPKIRVTRAEILYDDGVRSARVVAAFGKIKDLPENVIGRRRRLWLRSLGPLGQLGVRMADWRYLQSVLIEQPVPRSGAESEDVARLLDSLDGEPSRTARQRIEDAWQQYGRLPSLLLAHAKVDAAEGDDWHCLALAVEAVRIDPSNLEAICRLAQAIRVSPFGYGTAVEMLESLPETVRSAPEVRVSLGDLHYYAGNFALAAAAYGNPRDLNEYDRKSRRRSIRRGLLRRHRLGNAYSGTLDLAIFNPVGSAIARLLDESASLLDQPDQCREMLQEAIVEHGRQPLLLLQLARAERYAGDSFSCATLATEALTSTPDSPLVTIMSIWELWLADYDTEALRALSDLDYQNRKDQATHAAAGYIYHYWGLVAHAVDAFGQYALESWDRRVRRSSWWRSGGPDTRLRSWIWEQEKTFLSSLSLPDSSVSALAALTLPAQVAGAARSDLNSYRLGMLTRTQLSPGIAWEWYNRVPGPVTAVLAAIALTVIEFLRWPSNGVWQNLGLSAAASVGAIAVAWIVGKTTRRVLTRIVIAIFFTAAAAFLLQMSQQWLFSAGLALAALALAIMGDSVCLAVLGLAPRVRGARWQRFQAQTAITDDLLDLLSDLNLTPSRRDAQARREWMSELERIAVAMEQNIPHVLRSGDSESQKTIVAHTRDVAAAIRALEGLIAFPSETTWDLVTTKLQELASALARGEIADAPVRPPTAAIAQRKQPWWRHAMEITRRLLVIFAPPLVAFLLPLVAPLTGPGVAWLRLATLVWALLACIVVLDPKIADSVSKMSTVLNLLRQTTPSQGDTGQADYYGPPEQMQQRIQPGSSARAQGASVTPDAQSRSNRTNRRRRRSSR